MLEQDDLYGEESYGVGRGMLFGAVLGLILWAAIIGLVYVMFF